MHLEAQTDAVLAQKVDFLCVHDNELVMTFRGSACIVDDEAFVE